MESENLNSLIRLSVSYGQKTDSSKEVYNKISSDNAVVSYFMVSCNGLVFIIIFRST